MTATMQYRRLAFFIGLTVFVSLFIGVFIVCHRQTVILKILENYYGYFMEQPILQPTEISQYTALPESSSKLISSLCNCSRSIKIMERDPRVFDWCGAESSMRGKYQKVITYTLYGNTTDPAIFKRYYSYLNDIAVTAEKEYPGWYIRIYHNFTEGKAQSKREERAAHDLLCDVYCKFPHVDLCSVPLMVKRIGHGNKHPIDPALLQGLNPRMLRYLAMLDPDVDIFISRDVDSIIWRREVDAVEEWLRSNFTFHLMRDHQSHGSIILAGMWGAKIKQRRDLIEGLMRALISASQDTYPLLDQATLDRILWPVAKYDVMAHDCYHCENQMILQTSPIKVFPFPSKRDGSFFVGGVGRDLPPIPERPRICPEACRPPFHNDWEYC